MAVTEQSAANNQVLATEERRTLSKLDSSTDTPSDASAQLGPIYLGAEELA